MILRIASILSLLLLLGCPKGGMPGIPSNSDGVNPNACGGYAKTEVGAKLKGFFKASVQLNEIVLDAEGRMKASCKLMAKILEIDQSGETKDVCARVSASIEDGLKVGLKAGAKLVVEYEPPVCSVDVNVAASAAAKCEGQASADVAISCEGSCSGTCKGECDGTCSANGASGGCDGRCEGTCKGECSGGCEGHADVNASAECEAQAEVQANANAKCTKPELKVEFAADAVVDKGRIKKIALALKEGFPRILMLSAKMKGPVTAAFKTWADSAKGLAKSSADLYGSLGAQASCVSGQLAGAVGMIGGIQSSMDVQMDVSVSMSASASAEGSASAGQ